MHSILKSEQQALTREEQDVQEMLNRRYDDSLNGKATLLDPDDVRREVAARHAADVKLR
jgi:hypothetical protein